MIRSYKNNIHVDMMIHYINLTFWLQNRSFIPDITYIAQDRLELRKYLRMDDKKAILKFINRYG
jgi:hypothetical protein